MPKCRGRERVRMTDAVRTGICSQALTAETYTGGIQLPVPGQIGNQSQHDTAEDRMEPRPVVACDDVADSDIGTDGDKSLMREHEFRRIVPTATAEESGSTPIGRDDRRILFPRTVVIR